MNEKLTTMLKGVEHLYPYKTDERFPHIVEKISILWGTVGMARYFSELLFNDRDSRQGFPPDIMAEIFALSNYHESHKPSRSAFQSAWHDEGENQRLERFKTVKDPPASS